MEKASLFRFSMAELLASLLLGSIQTTVLIILVVGRVLPDYDEGYQIPQIVAAAAIGFGIAFVSAYLVSRLATELKIEKLKVRLYTILAVDLAILSILYITGHW